MRQNSDIGGSGSDCFNLRRSAAVTHVDFGLVGPEPFGVALIVAVAFGPRQIPDQVAVIIFGNLETLAGAVEFKESVVFLRKQVTAVNAAERVLSNERRIGRRSGNFEPLRNFWGFGQFGLFDFQRRVGKGGKNLPGPFAAGWDRVANFLRSDRAGSVQRKPADFPGRIFLPDRAAFVHIVKIVGRMANPHLRVGISDILVGNRRRGPRNLQLPDINSIVGNDGRMIGRSRFFLVEEVRISGDIRRKFNVGKF